MHAQFWQYRCTKIDFEDLDVSVHLIHRKSLASVTVKFRVDESALDTSGKEIQAPCRAYRAKPPSAALEAKGRADEPVSPS